MKIFFIAFAMFVSSCVVVNAQYQASINGNRSVSPIVIDHSKEGPYTTKPPGLRMRNTGRTLTILGGAILIGGIVMVSSADELYYNKTYSNSGSSSEGDPQGGFGVLMIAAGTGMTIPGIIFWSKGHKRYQHHLEQERASLQLKSTGLALRYSF